MVVHKCTMLTIDVDLFEYTIKLNGRKISLQKHV